MTDETPFAQQSQYDKAELIACGMGELFGAGNAQLPVENMLICLLYTSPSPRDRQKSRMPSSA